MSSENSKTYINSEQLHAIERTLSDAGFNKSSPQFAGYAAFLIAKVEGSTIKQSELAQTLQRHHGATQFKLCHGLATRFHKYAIQGLTNVRCTIPLTKN
ncbi:MULTISPECIES: hypothetical protein [Rhizobium]|uniref:hypothetical protein n=1 Tax=Rhizobium TaxID=379 RepID=UPI00140CC62B|nr:MULTISPECIES: hypothetical protein [Rhizobium]MDG3578379.1 hypothetical protein [Rhizobium sp. YJ-22]